MLSSIFLSFIKPLFFVTHFCPLSLTSNSYNFYFLHKKSIYRTILFEKKYKDTLKNLRKYKKYVDELQSQGIISEIKLPDVEDTPKSEQQLQRDAFKNKIWKKIKKMF